MKWWAPWWCKLVGHDMKVTRRLRMRGQDAVFEVRRCARCLEHEAEKIDKKNDSRIKLRRR